MFKGKTIIIALFILFGLSANSQNEPEAEKLLEPVNIPGLVNISNCQDVSPLTLKKVEPISADPKVQNKSINYGKSQEIISVKAYIRKLHLKRKETLVS